jgi:hypothetical protein
MIGIEEINNIQLSYLLYNIDEVKYSFMLSLLFQTKHPLQEALFWAFELYKSKYGENLWNILTQLYYDFYYIKGISFEKTIHKEYESWKHTNSFQHIAKIVKELHKQPIVTNIFQYYYNGIACNNTASNSSHIDCDKTFLEQTSLDLTQSFRYLRLKSVDEIKNIYKTRYRLNNKKDICLFYTNQQHRWTVKLITKLIKRKTIWIKTKLNDNDNIFICKLHEPASKVYKTLKEKRLYEVNDNIGAFPLQRFNQETDVVFMWIPSIGKYIPDDVDKTISAYLYNWEYYAKDTPFWSDVFKTHHVSFKKKKIVFPDDDVLEQFYDNHGLEPDEQCKETQMKSVKPIKKINIKQCFQRYNITIEGTIHTYSV